MIVIARSRNFRCWGFIIQDDGEFVEDITNRIKAMWVKWRIAFGVLCDRKIPLGLIGKVYKMVIRLVMMYGLDCCSVKKLHTPRMNVANFEMGVRHY